MTEEKINKIKQASRINPHKLFPDNPAPYSHIWEMKNELDEIYIVNWDTQTIEHTPKDFPDLKQCYKITEARFQKNPLFPGLYVKVDHENNQFYLLEHCSSLKIDGKEYVPYWQIEPTPGRELPPLDNPDAEWTGVVTDKYNDWTDEEKEILLKKDYLDSQERYFERKKRELDVKEALSPEQIDYIAEQRPGYDEIVDMCMDYISGRTNDIDPNFFPEEAYEINDYDLDITDE